MPSWRRSTSRRLFLSDGAGIHLNGPVRWELSWREAVLCHLWRSVTGNKRASGGRTRTDRDMRAFAARELTELLHANGAILPTVSEITEESFARRIKLKAAS